MPKIFVHLLPSLLGHSSLVGSSAVVIDILRASTTMIHALEHGATAVIPCLTIDTAQAAAEAFPTSARLLGGERKGELIKGFDLDNSPLKYTPEVVAGKTVIFTTTNGTKALLECRAATRVCVGAFVNQSAVVNRLIHWGRDVHLMCAGTDGVLTGEDILFAGSATEAILTRAGDSFALGNLSAQMTLDYFQARNQSESLFQAAFLDSQGARNLTRLGMTNDIERAMQRDLFEGVPIWDVETNRITLSH